jgi:hypothetical protein
MRRLLLIVCLLLAAPAWATEYIVNGSPTGCSGAPCSDSNNCTTLSTACATINGAKVKATLPGDIVTIKAGTYFEDIDTVAGGSSGNPITFRAATGESVTVTGSETISGWAQDPTYTKLWSLTLAAKPTGLTEEYATPRFVQISNAGSWYQDRVGYVDVDEANKCGVDPGASTCDLAQLNSLCGGTKSPNGMWCYLGGKAYVRPGAYGIHPTPSQQGNTEAPASAVEVPTSNTWRAVRYGLLVGHDWVAYEGITFKDMPINLCAADNVKFDRCYHMGYFLGQSAACVNATNLTVLNTVAENTFRGNSYMDGNDIEGDGAGFVGGGQCASSSTFCSCSGASCAADSECGGGACVPRRGIPNFLFDGLTLRNTRNIAQVGASSGAIIRNSQLGPGSNHGLLVSSEGGGAFTVENTTFFHSQDAFWLEDECNSGSCPGRTLKLNHVTFMGPETTRSKTSTCGGIDTANSGPGHWDIIMNNSLSWRSRPGGFCDGTQYTWDGDFNVFYGSGGGGSTSDAQKLSASACKVDASTGLNDVVVPLASDTDPLFNTVFEDTTPENGRSPHLKAGSPVLNLGGACRGAGCTNLTTDYEGTVRPQGPAKDPGADELGAAAGEVCGNGVRASTEVCDGGQLNSQTCLTVPGGFTGGTLACCDNVSDGAGCGSTHNCSTFDTTNCTTSSTQCNDSLDNDGDGFSDLTDIGCTDPSDNTETVPAGSSFSIPCTSAGLVQAYAWMNASPGKTITFNCSNTTIVFDTATYAAVTREILSDGNVVDGESKGIVIEPSQSWITTSNCNASATQPCDADSNGIPDGCPDANDQIPRFLVIRGDSNTIRNFKIAKWGDGIRFNTGTPASVRADNNTVENFHCDFSGDNCASWDPPSGGETYADVGRGNIVRNSVCKFACDKCHQVYGRDSGWANAADFDGKLEGITCTDSVGCVRANGNGYFVVDGLNVGTSGAAPHAQYATADYGIRSDGASTGGIFDATDLIFTGVDTGIIAAGDTQVRVTNSTFAQSGTEGIRADGTAKVMAQGNTFTGAIGINLITGSTATVDAGGGSTVFTVLGTLGSTGGNDFDGCSVGVNNGIASYTTKAEACCWSDSDPSNEVSGLVDFSPLGACTLPPSSTPKAGITCTACGSAQ